MVQARKVQYQCMSKLSAKELANRGHQFLANGDKRKSSNLTGSKDKPTVRNSYKSGKGRNYCEIITGIPYCLI